MPCPDCKGSSRTAIAPGYWQCTTLVWCDATQWGPMPGTPPHLGIMGPVPAAVQQPCGRRYHEAGGGNEVDVNASCACGIFAIGRCADCGDFVCGEPKHSALYEGRLTCRADIGRRQQEAAQARQRAADDAARRADQEKIAAITSGVAAGGDAIERWLLARTADLSPRRFSNADAQRVAVNRVRALIREAAGARSVNVAGDDVMQWSVKAPDLIQWLSKRRSPDAILRGGLFKTYRGWRIGYGQTEGGYRDSGWSYQVVLRTDGRISRVGSGSRNLGAHHERDGREFGSQGDINMLATYLERPNRHRNAVIGLSTYIHEANTHRSPSRRVRGWARAR